MTLKDVQENKEFCAIVRKGLETYEEDGYECPFHTIFHSNTIWRKALKATSEVTLGKQFCDPLCCAFYNLKAGECAANKGELMIPFLKKIIGEDSSEKVLPKEGYWR